MRTRENDGAIEAQNEANTISMYNTDEGTIFISH